ncbi:MAG: phage major capsid protein [Aliarcobacter sp.]
MSYIPRSGAEALMPEEFQREIIENVPEMSAVMSLAKKAPNMSRSQRRMPVLSVLPMAYFINAGSALIDASDIQLKKTTRMLWENKYLDAEELAVIVPIPESVLEDSDYDIWAQVRPKLLEAFGLAFDQAVFYGINAPAIWPDPIVTTAMAADNYVPLGACGDLYDDIMGEGGVIAKVEEDGFMVNGHVAAMVMRGKMRGLRERTVDPGGQISFSGPPIFKALTKEGVQGKTSYELDGEQVLFPRNGSIDASRSLMISGDWSQLIYAMRKDITWKILSEAVIQDPDTNEILYNLAQQDMIAIRAVMRLAWQVPNPVNRLRPDEDERYPFAVLGPSGS